jgi:penicillin-insensitive murein endopeptidase
LIITEEHGGEVERHFPMRNLLTGSAIALASVLLLAAAAGPDYTTPAKTLFGEVKTPSEQKTTSIGSFAKGCLAGAVSLPTDGPAWQVMRLSRNRNWGTPQLVSYIMKLATDARDSGDWPGLLIGDMSQPRGGPMATGHASHQIGLDVDVWLTPMPSYQLTAYQREKLAATSLLIKGKLAVDPKRWSDSFTRLLKRAASYPEVARIFVSAAIKQQLCDTVTGDRAWLRKIRPWGGHDDHFHVRLVCPPGVASCVDQSAPPAGDGCGDDLAWWFKPHPPPEKPAKPPPPLTLAGLPKACTGVLYDGVEGPGMN